jgi:alkylation response protein AidB-like acyl-CoA dehydrogenase
VSTERLPVEERYSRDEPLVVVGEGTDGIRRQVIAERLVRRGGLPG